MHFKYLFYLVLVIFISCQSGSSKQNKKLDKTKKQEKELIVKKTLKLKPEAVKLIDSWGAYQEFKGLFKQYQHTTASEALNNAKELNDLAKQLIDFIKNESLRTTPFKARLDVLHNETMRLQDMVDIPNLKPIDIKNQIDKIADALNATNAKLNNLAIEKQIDKDLVEIFNNTTALKSKPKLIEKSKVIRYTPKKTIRKNIKHQIKKS